MTIDEGFVSTRELMRRTEAEDLERQRQEYLEQRDYESPEAEEARWSGIFRQQAAEMPEVHYAHRPAIDRRVFAVDGEIPEQIRRDAEDDASPWITT